MGDALDDSYTRFSAFDQEGTVDISPDRIVPSIGFENGLTDWSQGVLKVEDFYRGCLHNSFDNVFIVGFARPIIGNIPSISEMQAKYVSRLISGKIPRSGNIDALWQDERQALAEQFPNLPIEKVYPVEMFAYCDVLARDLDTYPKFSLPHEWREWVNFYTQPAVTLQYSESRVNKRVFMPKVLVVLLFLIRSFDGVISCLSGFKKSRP
ncbi:MAG: hypothetical protein ACPGN3_10360 [Opitutales bacterium]